MDVKNYSYIMRMIGYIKDAAEGMGTDAGKNIVDTCCTLADVLEEALLGDDDA